jgi:hypothetical protein
MLQIVTMPSASQFIASSSDIANPIFQGFLPIAYWIVGAILGVTFILLLIILGERVYHAVVGH